MLILASSQGLWLLQMWQPQVLQNQVECKSHEFFDQYYYEVCSL